MIPSPVNECQRQYNELCALGGGRRGGPTRTRVQALLSDHGKLLNDRAYDEVGSALDVAAGANPWHVFFAVGLCWGEMAKYSDRYLRAAVGAISHWNDTDRRAAIEHFTQKGSDLLEGSIRSAYVVFEALPASFNAVPSSLDGLVKLQNRWFAKLNAFEPPYIGPWNATALFMVSLFAQPALAGQMTTMGPILPSGGPISRALNILYQDHLTERGAQALEDDVRLGGLGGAAADNGTMQDLIRGLNGTSMVDIHSGLYMLGTRDVRSVTYFD